MPTKRLKDFLDKEGVEYLTIQHSQAFTMSQVAHLAHISGKKLAKTVMIELDGKLAMAVLPSNDRVDLALLEELTGSDSVTLASEDEFKKAFPECEAGAMPPFGNLYGMDVFVSPKLERNEQIAFNAGTHTELLQLAYRDFERLVKPKVLEFAR
jgi:Ala-tRNA(Pro) deacylase